MSKVSIMIPLNYREQEAPPDQMKGKEERKVKSSWLGTVQAPWARAARNFYWVRVICICFPLWLLWLVTGRNLSHSSDLLNTVVQKFHCNTVVNHFLDNSLLNIGSYQWQEMFISPPCKNSLPPIPNEPFLWLTVIFMDYLKVLHRCLSDSAMEVQDIGLSVIIPHWGLVVKLNQVLHGFVLPFWKQALMVLFEKKIITLYWEP